jgi:hypothetical protein
MDKFKQYNMKITSKNEKLISDYLSKLKNTIEKYSIDKELYDDIEERLFEKLKNYENPDELSIKKVLKEI